MDARELLPPPIVIDCCDFFPQLQGRAVMPIHRGSIPPTKVSATSSSQPVRTSQRPHAGARESRHQGKKTQGAPVTALKPMSAGGGGGSGEDHGAEGLATREKGVAGRGSKTAAGGQPAERLHAGSGEDPVAAGRGSKGKRKEEEHEVSRAIFTEAPASLTA